MWVNELKDHRLLVNTVNPGGTRTPARAEAFPDEDPASLKFPEAVGQAFIELALTDQTVCAFNLDQECRLVTSQPGVECV